MPDPAAMRDAVQRYVKCLANGDADGILAL